MFHKGARVGGGDLPGDLIVKIGTLLDEFADIVREGVTKRRLRGAVVRSMLTCSIVSILDRRHLFIAAQKQSGMASTINLDHRDKEFPIEEVLTAAKWEFGFDDPFVVPFPAEILEQSASDRRPTLESIAAAHIQSELQRVERQMSVIQVNPVFGPASYAIDSRLTFVLMPFLPELTQIYATFVKPTVEDPQFGLVCRRADDVKSNKAIIQDIWKSICEARLVIADLTGLNPNVMYELGIAHTVGKETILIYQTGGDVKFPFDLAHIRRIEYDNSALGGRKLEQELRETLASVLQARVMAKGTG